MNGHPALAYVIARQMQDERRRASEHPRPAYRTEPKTLHLAGYRLTIAKERV
jgi:hypothetical protein